MNILEERYLHLQAQIAELSKKSQLRSSLTLIAVSKRQPVESIEALYRLGHRDFGENYVQELLTKNQILRDRGIHDIQWHFIGHLQRNKVKSLLPLVDTIHTVDSLELAAEIGKRWGQLQKPNRAKIFLEVNLHSESTKSGFDPQDLRNQARLLNEIQELEIRGLMCIPDPNEDSQESFVRLRILEESCRPFTHSCLSMGMSNDYAVAIQEGATHIRVGTSLFGERHPSPTQ